VKWFDFMASRLAQFKGFMALRVISSNHPDGLARAV
jgi:hypothetical protein